MEHKLSLSNDIDAESLMTFSSQIWHNKPNTHNKDIKFYTHLNEQPSLTDKEPSIVRLVRGKTTEALLCFMKYKYKGQSVYSGLNLYALPEFTNNGVHGIRLIQYWKKHCSIMFSAAPRMSSAMMYERAGWKCINTHVFRFPIKISSKKDLLQKFINLIRIHVLLNYNNKRKKLLDKHVKVICEEINKFDEKDDVMLKTISENYNYFNKGSEELNWRYLTYKRKEIEFKSYRVKCKEGDYLIGYFVLSIFNKHIKVCEIFSIPNYWEYVFSCLMKKIKSSNKNYLIIQTNFFILKNICKNNGFYVTKINPNYFKIRKEHSHLLSDIQSKNFIISPSDSDEYLQ